MYVEICRHWKLTWYTVVKNKQNLSLLLIELNKEKYPIKEMGWGMHCAKEESELSDILNLK